MHLLKKAPFYILLGTKSAHNILKVIASSTIFLADVVRLESLHNCRKQFNSDKMPCLVDANKLKLSSLTLIHCLHFENSGSENLCKLYLSLFCLTIFHVSSFSWWCFIQMSTEEIFIFWMIYSSVRTPSCEIPFVIAVSIIIFKAGLIFQGILA